MQSEAAITNTATPAFATTVAMTPTPTTSNQQSTATKTTEGASRTTSTSTSDSTTHSSSSTTATAVGKRKRTVRKPYHISAAEHIENRCLIQAIQNSKVDQIRLQMKRQYQHRQQQREGDYDNTNIDNEMDDDQYPPIPVGPIFYPSYDEFINMTPIQYIEEIVRPIAEQYGICKIVPPAGWNPKPYFPIPITTNDDEVNDKSTMENDNENDSSGSSPETLQQHMSPNQQRAAVTDDSNASDETLTTANIVSPATTTVTTTAPPVITKSSDVSRTKRGVHDEQYQKKFETKYQLLHRLQEGLDFQDGQEYTPVEYIDMAYHQTMEYLNLNHHFQNQNNSSNNVENNNNNTNGTQQEPPSQQQLLLENLEQDYWDIVEMVKNDESSKMVVEYGNDVDTSIFGSGFPLKQNQPHKEINDEPSKQDEKNNGSINMGDNDEDDTIKYKKVLETEEYYRNTNWNLNNIPSSPASVLQHITVPINGINVPWMYYGSLFTTFCWHNEDNYLYSINYHHMGSPKQWYGVPGLPKDAPDGVEKVFKSYLSMKMRDVPDLLHHITTMFSPRLLQNVQVPVYKMIQYSGEFIITFPRAYHCGFSYGPNIGEAVNFGTTDWIYYSADANEKYRLYHRPTIFSHDRLALTIAHHYMNRKQSNVSSIDYNTCQILLHELKRVIDEEMIQRTKLLSQGVRDVSHLIQLRKIVYDTPIDDECINYDDQRTCHYCKYICYYSAVGCQCSQSKVSCLRHSHFMCTCPNTSKYLMIWTHKDELLSILDRMERYCTSIQKQQYEQQQERIVDVTTTTSTSSSSSSTTIISPNSMEVISSQSVTNANSKGKKDVQQLHLPKIAIGVKEDYERHQYDCLVTHPKTWKYSK